MYNGCQNVDAKPICGTKKFDDQSWTVTLEYCTNPAFTCSHTIRLTLIDERRDSQRYAGFRPLMKYHIAPHVLVRLVAVIYKACRIEEEGLVRACVSLKES